MNNDLTSRAATVGAEAMRIIEKAKEKERRECDKAAQISIFDFMQ